MLRNKGLGIKAKNCLYEGVILLMSLCGAEAWDMRSAERFLPDFLMVYEGFFS